MHGRTVFLSLLLVALSATNAFAASEDFEGRTLTFTAPAGATNYQTVNESATAPSDYTARSGTVLPGQTVEVPTVRDSAAEGDETLIVRFTGLTTTDVRGTIRDVAHAVQDVSVNEGAGFADVVVARGAVDRPTSVAYATGDGTATPQDYTGASGSLTFPEGATQATFRVPLTNDSDDELDETIAVSLSNASADSAIGDGSGTVTIVNDDLRAVSVGDVTATEGDGPNVEIKLPVTLSSPTFRPVTVQFATLDAFARAPVDFLSRLGAVTIPAGQQGATIDLAVVSDDRAEPVETFGVLLGNPVNGVVGRGAAVVTVNDDDSGTSNDDTVPTLRLTRLRRSGRAITVRLTCPRQETRCSARLTLFSSADRRSRARTLRTERRIGRRSLSLRGGQSRTVRVSLPRTILAAARRAGRLKVSAFTVTRDAADNVHSGRRSATLRFRRR